jgi:hypothetical protein
MTLQKTRPLPERLSLYDYYREMIALRQRRGKMITLACNGTQCRCCPVADSLLLQLGLMLMVLLPPAVVAPAAPDRILQEMPPLTPAAAS